jgi:hypothetical protein
MSILALLACQVEIAPADQLAADADQRGRTALGERVIVAAPDGVTDFGEHLAVIRGELVLTEAAPGPCDRRLRKIDLPDLDDPDLITCMVPGDASFGTTLSGNDVQTVTGDQAIRYTSADGRLSDELDGASGPFRPVVLDKYRTMVGDPSANAVHAFVHSTDLRHDHTLPTPDGLADDAGFGAQVLASHDLLVASTATGEPTFYAPHATSWKHWEIVAGPPVARVLALYGNEILAELPDSDDLAFYTLEEGSWTATGTLTGARDAAADWVFDPVAAFAVTPRSAAGAGAVVRWVRLDDTADASVAFSSAHTDLTATLDGNRLFVGEPTADGGQVHVFDWTEDRTAFFADVGGHHEEVCQYVPESSLAFPLDLTATPTSGDIDADTSAFFHTVVPPGSGVDLVLTSPWGGASGFDLDVTDALGVMIDTDAGRMEDGVQRRRWDNFGNLPLDLYIEVVANANDHQRTCRAFDFSATPVVHDEGYCTSRSLSTELLDVVGMEMKLRGETTDRFSLDLEPGRDVRIALQHDDSPRNIKMRLRDADDGLLSFGGGDVILHSADSHERVYVEVEFVDRAPGVCGTYVLDVDLTFPDWTL